MEYSELNLIPQVAKNATCAFTGNRPHRLPWGDDESDSECVSVKAILREKVRELIEQGVVLFVCGMANGADLYFAETVIALKAEYPSVMLEGAVPYHGQERTWPRSERERYEKAIKGCDFVTVVSEHGSKWAPLKRNRYMVDKASILLSLNYAESGGSAYTERYARENKVKIIKINDNI